MSQKFNRFKAIALATSLSFCPVIAGAQVPGDEDIAILNEWKGAQQIPNAQQTKDMQQLLEMPDAEQLNEQMDRVRESTSRTLNDPSLLKNKSPVPDKRLNAATQNEREAYLSNVERSSTQALQSQQERGGKDNLSSVIEQYQNEQNRAIRRMQSDVPDIPKDALLVFVSFSMPEAVLSNLAKQARAVGATLVLRGMKDGSLRETKESALAVNRAGAPWQINPQLFESFNVKTVPTFVVTGNKDVIDQGCPADMGDACSLAGSFASISGDLSIELALETIRLRSNVPYVRKLAEERLTHLKNQREG